MKKEFLECGKIVGAHGVKGLMKVESWCDTPKVLAAQKRIFFAEKDGSYKEAKVISASVSGPVCLMSIEGYDNREYVQGMKNTVLYLKREDIPVKPGTVFLADIIGLDAIDIDSGEKLGTVKDITDAVSSRLYVLETDKGLFIKPIPGFFD